MEDDRTIIKQLISHQFSNTTFFVVCPSNVSTFVVNCYI